MEVLIVILIAVFSIVSKTNKKNKAANKPAQAAKPADKPAKPARPLSDLTKDLSRQNIESAISEFTKLLDIDADLPDPDKPAPKTVHEPTAIEVELKRNVPAKAKAKKAKKPGSGESKVDEHGCIGGSMPVHNAEGESIAEHAEHEQNWQQKLTEEAALRTESFRKPSKAELRRAVVMSEVLGKPVSLRGRRI